MSSSDSSKDDTKPRSRKWQSLDHEEATLVNSLIVPKSTKLKRAKSANHIDMVAQTDHSSEEVDSSFESMSPNAAAAVCCSHLRPVSVAKAKQRNYLHGRSGADSLLGKVELERTFPKSREARIFVCTWNMNGEEAPKNLNDLFLADKLENLPDVYAIGTQESQAETDEWEAAIQETIGPSHVLFHSERMGTIHLGIFIRRELIWFCSLPEDDTFSVRPGSAFKTKGAVGISFYMFGSSFLFLTAHLTAHEDKVRERISDVQRIVKSLELPKEYPKHKRGKDVTQNFDYVFWFGDLNFRLTQPREQVMDWVKSQKFPCESDVPFHDQLTVNIKNGRVFHDFSEPVITFPPSYKFDVGTDVYDTSHKRRTPSYTDRILYKCKARASRFPSLSTLASSTNVNALAYTSVQSFRTSDHKPVWGLFTCKIRPGIDTIPLAAGLFNRNVYLEGMKRRAVHRKRSDEDSTNCTIQ